MLPFLSVWHVVLPPEVAKLLSKNRLIRRNGVQLECNRVEDGCAIHRPEPHIMLFRRPHNYQQTQENQAHAHQGLLAK